MPSPAELAEVSVSGSLSRPSSTKTRLPKEFWQSNRPSLNRISPAFGCNLLGSVGALKNSVAWRDSKRKLKRRSKTKKEHPKRRHRTRFGNGRCCFAKGGTLTERLDFQMEGGQQNIPERSRKIKKVGWDQRKVMG